jgi:hypothetical protein
MVMRRDRLPQRPPRDNRRIGRTLIGRVTVAPTEQLDVPAPAGDVVCLRCEYSLRGLGRDGRCPECGTPAESSFRRHELAIALGWTPLHLASPLFLRNMGRACALALVSAGIVALAGGGSLLRIRSGPVGSALMSLWWLLSLVALPLALWLAGSYEPAARAESRTQRARRWLIRCGGLWGPWHVLFLSLLLLRSGPPGFNWMLYRGVESALVAAVTWAVLRRLAQLARRAERRRLAACASALGAAWPIVILAQVFAFSAMPVRPSEMWMLMAKPMIGDPAVLLLLPYSLAVWPRLEPELLFWLLYLLLTAATLVVLAGMMRVFFSAAALARKET